MMFSQRANAVRRSEGLRGTTDQHLSKLQGDPTSRFARGWRTEINAHLDEISRLAGRMGRRTGEQWREYVQSVRDALNQIK
jgi:hypothetical protein